MTFFKDIAIFQIPPHDGAMIAMHTPTRDIWPVITLVILGFLACTNAHAQTTQVKSVPKSLQKHAAEQTQSNLTQGFTPYTQKSDTLWQSLSPNLRQQIMSEWQSLPETTRPPFPVYRDSAVQRCLQDAAKQDETSNITP